MDHNDALFFYMNTDMADKARELSMIVEHKLIEYEIGGDAKDVANEAEPAPENEDEEVISDKAPGLIDHEDVGTLPGANRAITDVVVVSPPPGLDVRHDQVAKALALEPAKLP